MIQTKLSFNGTDIVDSYERYGLIYVDSCNILHAPIEDAEESSYSDEDGAHSSDAYRLKGFDYTVRYVVAGKDPTGERANAIIQRFIEDVKNGVHGRFVHINIYKRIKIVGEFKSLVETDFLRVPTAAEFMQFELTIHVQYPWLCDFNFDFGEESCFSRGYWVGELPWLGHLAWKKNVD